MVKEYHTISQIAGPLLFVEKTEPVGYGELVTIVLPDGSNKRGQVLDSSGDVVVVQVFERTVGIDKASGVKFLGETVKMPVSRDMLGRILSGSGDPLGRSLDPAHHVLLVHELPRIDHFFSCARPSANLAA